MGLRSCRWCGSKREVFSDRKGKAQAPAELLWLQIAQIEESCLKQQGQSQLIPQIPRSGSALVSSLATNWVVLHHTKPGSDTISFSVFRFYIALLLSKKIKLMSELNVICGAYQNCNEEHQWVPNISPRRQNTQDGCGLSCLHELVTTLQACILS